MSGETVVVKIDVFHYRDSKTPGASRERYLSHTLTERWIKSEWFCVACGKQEVWEDEDPGDYHVGCSYLCARCGGSFSLPEARVETGDMMDDWDRQRIAAFQASQNGG